MKNLIVSWDSYSWIKFCSGMVARNPEDYKVMIIYSDDEAPLLSCKELCKEAIYAQRRHDLFSVGKSLGIKHISNLNYDSIQDFSSIIANIQINIMLQKPMNIFYQNKKILNSLFNEISKFNIPTYSFGINLNDVECLEVELTTEELENKNKLKSMLIGVNDKFYLSGYPKTEKFFKL